MCKRLMYLWCLFHGIDYFAKISDEYSIIFHFHGIYAFPTLQINKSILSRQFDKINDVHQGSVRAGKCFIHEFDAKFGSTFVSRKCDACYI